MEEKRIGFASGVQYKYTHDEKTDTYEIEDVEVFGSGNWNGEEYGVDFLSELVAADADVHEFIKPRLGIGHPVKGENPTVAPAFGWFGRLKEAGGKINTTLKGVPAAVFEAVKAGHYGPVSVELAKDFKHPETGKVYPYVLDAVKFLGLQRPAVTTTLPVSNFGSNGQGKTLVLEQAIELDEPPVVGDSDDDEKPTASKAEEGESMSDEIKAQAKSLSDAQTALDADRDKFETERKEFAAKMADAKERKINEAWSGLISGGNALPKDEASFKSIAGTMSNADTDRLKFSAASGDEISGTPLDGFIETWKARKAPAKATGSKMKKADVSENPETDPGRRVFAAIKAKVDGGIELNDAIAQVEIENADDVKAWEDKKEVRK